MKPKPKQWTDIEIKDDLFLFWLKMKKEKDSDNIKI